MTNKDLLPRIEQYLVDNNLSATGFGRAVGNVALLTHLRSGGGLRKPTEQRIERLLNIKWEGHQAAIRADREAERQRLLNERRRECEMLLAEIVAFCTRHNITKAQFCKAAQDRHLTTKLKKGACNLIDARSRSQKVFDNPTLVEDAPIGRPRGSLIHYPWEESHRIEMERSSRAMLMRMIQVHPERFGAAV